MCRNHFIFVLLSTVCFTVSSVCGDSLPERLAGWKLTEAKTYSGQALYDYINGGAEVYMEYGFSKVEVGYYGKGEQELLIEVYRMSSPKAALGIYSFFRDHAASSLPKPYQGKMYQFHLECLNGNEYVKLINYDSLGTDEQLNLLRDFLPQPFPSEKVDYSKLLPKQRIPESEVLFNGPLALKNFCPLGRKNFFGVGKRTKAYGCLIKVDGKKYKWLTLVSDSTQLANDRERYLAFQKRNDYTVESRPRYDFLEDQLSGNNIMMAHRDDRIMWIFGIQSEERALDLLRSIH